MRNAGERPCDSSSFLATSRNRVRIQVDGRNYFHDEGPGDSKSKQILFSVKSGATGPTDVRDLRGVIDREKAAIGVFVTLKTPTKEMRKEAASAGFYESPWAAGTDKVKYPRLQIYTIKELLDGTRPELPRVRDSKARAFKSARKAKGPKEHQRRLLD